MTLSIGISVFFGLVAAIALLSCFSCIRYGLLRLSEIQRELRSMDRACEPAPRQLRRPREAFVRLAA